MENEGNPPIVIDDIFKQRKIISNEEEIKFIISQINFYTNLCKGRHTKWKKFIKMFFPKEFMFDIINNENYSFGKKVLIIL